ncbi:MAG: PorT family protein [Tidjanibacter sp.]|nr:PorT family protein [Tidjanibacter sp.]MBQ3071512.1 PorT family protein [Tidjanibacter sp.]
MKKILLAMAVLVMSVATVSAQSHKWFWFGPKAGLTSTAAEVTMEGDGMQSVLDGAASYNAGLMFRLNVPISIFSLHLQPELMYNWHKGDLKNPETGKVEIKDVTLNEFSVPILAGVGMDLGLFNARVQAGPVVVFNSNAVISGENADTAGIDWKDVSYTWAAGVGIDLFNFIMLDFRYLGGWQQGMEPKNFGELFNFDNINKETNTWYVSLGVMF